MIAQRLTTSVPLVGQISHYIIASGGKRLRPALLLLVCGALGYTGAQRFNLAAVVAPQPMKILAIRQVC